jgi:hypothetical protein
MHEETNEETTCPITLEPIVDGQAFVHVGTAFDATALYSYLLQAPHLTNPVNRIPFERVDLLRLEALMEDIYGEGCILHTSPSPSGDLDDDVVVLDTQDDENDWFDHLALMDLFTTVVEEQTDNTIRLRVDYNVSSPPAPPSSVVSDSGSDDETSSTCSSLDLPPSRVFDSVVALLDDAEARARRMTDQLQVLQFLDFEAVDLVRRMLELANPDSFHALVWSNTQLAIMQAVVEYLRLESSSSDQEDVAGVVVTELAESPPSLPEYNLHIQYDDAWIDYRGRLHAQLTSRYRDVMTDIRRIGPVHADASARSHVTMVREYAATFSSRDVQDTLSLVSSWMTTPSH